MKQLVLKHDKPVHSCVPLDAEAGAAFAGFEDLWLCPKCHPLLWKDKFQLSGAVSSKLIARLSSEELNDTLNHLMLSIRGHVLDIFKTDAILPTTAKTVVKPYRKTGLGGGLPETITQCYEVTVYINIVRTLPVWGDYMIYGIPIVIDVQCDQKVAGQYLINGMLYDIDKPEYNRRRKLRRFSTLGVTEEGGS